MQDPLNLLNQDYYLNYPLIYALKHGAELIGANQWTGCKKWTQGMS